MRGWRHFSAQMELLNTFRVISSAINYNCLRHPLTLLWMMVTELNTPARDIVMELNRIRQRKETAEEEYWVYVGAATAATTAFSWYSCNEFFLG